MKLNIKKALSVLVSAVMIITATLLPTTAFGAAFKQPDNGKNYVEGEIIVVLKETAGAKYMKAADVKSSYGSSFTQKDAFTFGTENKTRTVVLKSKTLTTEQMLKQVKKNGAVKSAFPNYIKHASSITNDTYSEYQWALDNTGQNNGTPGLDTNADVLWDAASASENEQVVAIVDTGIDYENDELKDVVWNNPYGKKLLGKHGMDFTGEIENGEPYDDNGHGTHCAGIIAAAANNNKGISGINTSNVKIMALKFLDENGYGSVEAAIASYDYLQRAIKLGTNVIACNNSWGGGGDLEELALFNTIFDELGELGCISFAAAGNESYNLDTEPEDEDYYIDVPSMCTSPYCITVAASNENDDLADFSNYGNKSVDIAAPGADILSTVSYNCFNPTLYTDTQKDELCKYIQDYNDGDITGEFGNITQIPVDTEVFTPGTNYETSFVDGFGNDGKALQIKLTDDVEENSFIVYGFEIPFTLDSEDQPYSISIQAKGNYAYEMPVYDVPATVSAKDALEKYDFCLYCSGSEKDNYWSHKVYDADPSDKFIEYKKAKERKLILLVASSKKDTTVTIDNLAISKQGANADDFGKYDFYNGTSMATPYATGAAALIKNANPDASTLDIVNIIRNTGRHSDYLVDKTVNATVLSLDNIDKVPPYITGAAYNEAGEIEVTGSFKNTTKVKINDAEVEFTNPENGKLIIPDNNYSTNKITVSVENANGSDSYTTLVSKKPIFNTKMLESSPDTFGTMAVPAGDKIFFVNPYGPIGTAQYYEDDDTYSYYDIGSADLTKIFEGDMNLLTAAAYYNGNLYMTALNYIQSPRTSVTIGYESALVKYDLTTGTTTKIADVPDDAFNAASLAVYNGDLYLIGGFDYGDTNKCSDKVFKLEGDTFVEQTAKLPEGRGGARFLQYKDKLVGMYGYNDNGTIPGILVFDGTEWKESAVHLESDDFEYEIEFVNGTVIRTFNGNLGYGEGGIFANGSYIYGVGDSFTYDVDTDSITSCQYTAKNKLDDTPLLGSTIPGAFIAFPVNQQIISEDDSDVAVGALSKVCGTAYDDIADGGIDSGDGEDEDAPSQIAYTMKLNNVYPTVSTAEIERGYAVTPMDYYFNYGDKVTVEIKSDPGYAVTKIYANGKAIATNSQTAEFAISDKETNITSRNKLVASHIAGLKLKAIKGTSYTLSWNKAKTGTGYQVQQYVGGKWKTVKTIKNLNTTTYKATVKSGTAKFRVRAYGTFNSRTVYGSAQTKEIYIPKKQAVKSLTGDKGAFTVKYSKDNKATGYEIQYSKNKDFTDATTVNVTKKATVSKKISKLGKGKYFVRVRSYKTIDETTIYGAYSAAKSVAVK